MTARPAAVSPRQLAVAWSAGPRRGKGPLVTEAARLQVLAVPARDPRYADLRDLSDLPGHLLDEIGHFVDIYKELEPGKGTDVRSWQDRAAAEDVISQAWARAQTR